MNKKDFAIRAFAFACAFLAGTLNGVSAADSESGAPIDAPATFPMRRDWKEGLKTADTFKNERVTRKQLFEKYKNTTQDCIYPQRVLAYKGIGQAGALQKFKKTAAFKTFPDVYKKLLEENTANIYTGRVVQEYEIPHDSCPPKSPDDIVLKNKAYDWWEPVLFESKYFAISSNFHRGIVLYLNRLDALRGMLNTLEKPKDGGKKYVCVPVNALETLSETERRYWRRRSTNTFIFSARPRSRQSITKKRGKDFTGEKVIGFRQSLPAITFIKNLTRRRNFWNHSQSASGSAARTMRRRQRLFKEILTTRRATEWKAPAQGLNRGNTSAGAANIAMEKSEFSATKT